MATEMSSYANDNLRSLCPAVKDFFHKDTNTCTFVVYDPATKDAVIIDSVMDLDTINWQTSHTHNDMVLAYVKDEGLRVHYIFETHVHADHLTGMAYLKKQLGAATVIGSRIVEVQKTFALLLHATDVKTDGSQFDHLVGDGAKLQAGSMAIECLHTPGHTPACMCLLIGDCVFTGDLMFTEDFGCGRCDFPGGSAEDMWESVMRIYRTLHPDTRVFVGHDYQPGGRPLRVSSTVKLQAEKQEDLPATGSRDDFVQGKTSYDKTLNLPRLIFPSLLVNINAGVLPTPEENGQRYFKIPMNTRVPTDEFGVPLKQ